MRPDAASTCPQVRRRPTWIGPAGVQVARFNSQISAASTASSVSAVPPGWLIAIRRRRDPLRITPQKKSVVSVPSTPPAGTA